MAVVAVCKFPPFLSLPFFAAVETGYNQRIKCEKIMLYVDSRYHLITGQNIQGDHSGQRLHFVELILKFLNHAQLFCYFCQIVTSPSKIGQWNIRSKVSKT